MEYIDLRKVGREGLKEIRRRLYGSRNWGKEIEESLIKSLKCIPVKDKMKVYHSRRKRVSIKGSL